MKSRRLCRTRFAHRLHHTAWPLCVAACTIYIAPARAGGCVDMRGGELLLSASDSCVAQMRGSASVRREVAQQIGSGVNASSTVVAAPPRAPSSRPPERSRSHGLDHPLARMSMLQAQSRYLWSLSNPAPVYYGQTQTQAR